MKNNIIGENIKKFRRAAKLTQQELAEKCGLARGTIQQYELGKREPRHDQQLLLCSALGIPTIALVTGTTDPLANSGFIAGMQDVLDILDSSEDLEAAVESLNLKAKLDSCYVNLNISGQRKAVEQIDLLTKIPEYRKEETE